MASDDTIKAGRCSIPDMEVYDVLYEDCDRPWIVCRCNDADEDVERLATDLGYVASTWAGGPFFEASTLHLLCDVVFPNGHAAPHMAIGAIKW
jgi:hypothetical protein